MISDRNAALEEIVRLAKTYNIGAKEISAQLLPASAREKGKGLISKLFSYMGGVFVFSGICVLIGMVWEDVGSLERVILTLGVGLTAFILGLVALKDERFVRAATPLFMVSGLLQPTGFFVFLHEYAPAGGDPVVAGTLIFAVLTIQHLLAYNSTRRTSLLTLSLVYLNTFIGFALDLAGLRGDYIATVMSGVFALQFFAGYRYSGRSVLVFLALFSWGCFITMAMDLASVQGDIITLTAGISILCLTWALAQTANRGITPFWYFVGGVCLLSGWWAVFEGTWLDISFLGVSALLTYLSIVAGSRMLLLVSVLGLLGYLAYFAEKYFADAVGWPICLIVLGLVMMGLSAYAVKLGRKIGEQGRIHA